jgi:general secretion pathway protein K
MTSRSTLSFRRQRGVALIMAVLIVALATVLAANVGFNAFLDLRRNATRYAMDQSFHVALGAEAWAADTLRRDGASGSKQDDFTEEWATPIPPMPVEGGEISGYLEDMQGRFNLNNLVMSDGKGSLVPNPVAIEQLQRLLELLELEPKWAALIADWIDSDGEASFPDGAEDSTYTLLTPPYRTAEAPITRASELLALHEFGLERYRRLEPFVTALPVGTKLNLCTASAEVLDSLVPGLREYTLDRKNLAEMRKERCFPTVQDFENRLNGDQRQQLRAAETLAERSSYFQATVWVTIGTTQFTLYSLLYRNERTQLIRPILRSFGTT